MNNLAAIVVVLMIGAIIYLSSGGLGGKRDKRKSYLEEMVKFLEAPLEKIEGEENSYCIKFQYKGREFIYEDIEEAGFKKSVFCGVLRAKTPFDLNLALTERGRPSMREGITSIQDVTSPWLQNVGKVLTPPELKEFSVFTNNMKAANALLSDGQILKILLRYKNIDSRGHPVMSLEFINGMMALRFHSTGGLVPSLFDLQGNASSIEDYLNKFLVILDKLQKLKDDEIT